MNPGLLPINIGKVLRIIAGKVVRSLVKDDETYAGEQDAACEAAVHLMHDIFATNATEEFYLFMLKTY